MEEHTIDESAKNYVTFADLMKRAKDVPESPHPTYPNPGALAGIIQDHVNQDIDVD